MSETKEPCEINLTEENGSSATPAKACRLCLNTESPLFNISKLLLVDSIKALTGIKVSTIDGLPQYICGYCKHLVKKFMSFRKRCLIANDVLKSAIELEVEITTDLIKAIDRAALNLTLSFVVANDFVDCLSKDYTDMALLLADDNATENSFDQLELTNDTVDTIKDQFGSPKLEINNTINQLELAHNEINYAAADYQPMQNKINTPGDILELIHDGNNYLADGQPIFKQDKINHTDDQLTLAKDVISYANKCNQSELQEKNNICDQLESSQKGMNNIYVQLEPSEDESNIFKILVDVCTTEVEQLEKSNNLNIIAKENILNDSVIDRTETLDSAVSDIGNRPLEPQRISTEKKGKSNTKAETLKIQDNTRDVCTSDCNLTYNEILSIKSYVKIYDDDESTTLCDSNLDEEPEVLPAVKISKETNVNLDIKLTHYDKGFLEKFFMKHYRFKEVYSEEKACLLERVKRVLEYNDSELVKIYDDYNENISHKRRKNIYIGNYLWVSSEKKRKEFEEKFNANIIMLTKEQQLEEFKARALSPVYERKLFKCVICFQGFMAEKPYMLHMKVHNPIRGKFECDICSYRFGSLVKYREHVLLHKSKFICKECGYTTNSVITAKEHHKWHMGHRRVCKYCNGVFSGKSTYFAHMKFRHPSELLSCERCGEVFLGRVGLKLHLSRDHGVAGKKSRLSKCMTCGVNFMSVKAMNNHLSNWDDGVCQPEVKSCVECGENFGSEELLLFHSTIHQKKFGCDLCEMSFVDESSLNIHYQRKHLNYNRRRRVNPVYLKHPETVKRSCTKQMKPICEYCGKAVHKGQLDGHINTHLGIEPYSCDICSKTFSNKYALKAHMIIHTNVRPYKCDLCGMTFQLSGNLKRHQDVHTGVKRFECEICRKRFGCKGSVQTHIRYVHMKIPQPPRIRKRRIEMETIEMEVETTEMLGETTEMQVETTETEVVEDMSWMPEFI